MKTLLLNGCSFAETWEPSDKFVSSVGCDNLINLGKAGTSFQRTCRSTIEWVAQNGSPDLVLIPITFAYRWELALNQDEDDIDGSWIPLQNSNFLSDDYKLQDSSIDDVRKLVDLYYGSIPTVKTYWDKLFTDIITFAGFLDHHQIPYLMWDMCNGFDLTHLKGYKAFEKIKFINQNKSIINIWSFCGNRYMRDTMQDDVKSKTPEFAHHHAPEQYKHLENYLLGHINQ